MRCAACDTILTEFEATRRGKESGEYVDLCDSCFSYVKDQIAVEENEELRGDQIDHVEDVWPSGD